MRSRINARMCAGAALGKNVSVLIGREGGGYSPFTPHSGKDLSILIDQPSVENASFSRSRGKDVATSARARGRILKYRPSISVYYAVDKNDG